MKGSCIVSVEIRDNIAFSRRGDQPLEAILYCPTQPAQAPYPIIIWVHGGGWRHGTRHNNREICETIAENGFICLSIDYRMSHEAVFPAQIQDCKCAVRYVRANAEKMNASPGKIGVWGLSAGGHLVALLGTSEGVQEFEGDGGWPDESSAVQAVCDWFGPTDLSQMPKSQREFDNGDPSPESLLIGGAIQDNPDKVQKANPITYISDSTPPFYIAHGTADSVVPFNHSELIHAALVEQGIDVTFEKLENAGHGGPGFEADSSLFERCIEFFRQHLT